MVKPGQQKKSVRYFLSLIVASARPNTWLRVWGEMIIAAVLASYPSFDFFSFLKGFIAVSPLLWSAAYMLNDLTDIKLDTDHAVRSKRPISSGRLDRKTALIIIFILVGLSVFIGVGINITFTILILLLCFSQILYTVAPIRLKERFLFDISINGINSILRFLLGWFTQVSLNHFFIPPLLFLLFIKLIFFIGHRMQNRQIEIQNNIKSTFAILTPSQLRFVIGLLAVAAFISLGICLYTSIFPVISIIGVLIGIVTIGVFLWKNPQVVFAKEQNLIFRNILYIDYFVMTNWIALTILFR